MCGFVALISKKSQPINPQLVTAMSEAIVHRGPDDDGLFINDWLGFGFRRLSIIDLSDHGHQPMVDSTGRYVGVFNGEIYNYLELRKELQQQGVIFSGNSDSEVLFKAYLHWGEACLNRLVGMFAFMVADRQKRTVFVARDFPGVKPLYFTQDENYFYFSSEVKAFARVMTLSADPDSYYEQFSFRYVAGDKTNFKHVIKVLPGQYWKIDLNTPSDIKKVTYFDNSDTFRKSTSVSGGMDAVVLETQSRLHDSFFLHTRSDVGYCVQLSGGVDSSYLTSVLARDNRDIDTFSIALDLPEFDESIYQKTVSSLYQTKHHSIVMNGSDYADNLERATYHMESPIVHSGCVFLMNLCRHIRAVSKVVLTGEGADELFGGYWPHKPSWYQSFIFLLQKTGFQGGFLPPVWKLKTMKKMLNNNLVLNAHRYQSQEDFCRYFSVEAIQNGQRRDYSEMVSGDYTKANLANDQMTYLSSVLDRQDKMSMSYSVEARVPYCHQDLYRFVNPVSSRYKIHQGERKSILKRCTKGYLPDDIVYRRKNGLRLPLGEWYRDPKSVGRYLELLTDQTARERGIYHVSAVNHLVREFRKGDTRRVKSICLLVNLELWHRVYRL